jgi:hypothetical protein
MAKKQAKAKKVETKQEFTKEDIEAALQIAHKDYFMQVLSLMSMDPLNTELGFVKVPMITEAGGIYLVSILHVNGPKLNLQQLAAKSDAVAEEEKQA